MKHAGWEISPIWGTLATAPQLGVVESSADLVSQHLVGLVGLSKAIWVASMIGMKEPGDVAPGGFDLLGRCILGHAE